MSGAREPYDFWLFDMDGTLLDTRWEYVRETFDRVGDRLGRRFSDREAEVVWNGLGGARDPYLRSIGVDPAAFWPAFHAVEDPPARAGASYLYEDAAWVGDLDVPVGVVTHCQPFLANPVVDELDVRDWFDAMVCCSDETGWKPDPAPVRTAMRAMDLPPDARGVLVGDAASDVGAAWNAGLDGVHVERHDPSARGRCVLGDYRVDALTDLPPVLRSA